MLYKILIVASDYYKDITKNLISHAKYILEEYDPLDFNIDTKIISGSFEIPALINQNLESYDGFIALGCLIRGETLHFELISNEVSRKIMDLSISSNKPIGFGIITCDNLQQAKARSCPSDSIKTSTEFKKVKGCNIAGNAAYAVIELLTHKEVAQKKNE